MFQSGLLTGQSTLLVLNYPGLFMVIKCSPFSSALTLSGVLSSFFSKIQKVDSIDFASKCQENN